MALVPVYYGGFRYIWGNHPGRHIVYQLCSSREDFFSHRVLNSELKHETYFRLTFLLPLVTWPFYPIFLSFLCPPFFQFQFLAPFSWKNVSAPPSSKGRYVPFAAGALSAAVWSPHILYITTPSESFSVSMCSSVLGFTCTPAQQRLNLLASLQLYVEKDVYEQTYLGIPQREIDWNDSE